MKKRVLILFLVCSLFLVCGPLMAQEAKVTSLMSKPLPDIPGKELLMIAVEYPPGSTDPVHRHNAQALVYMLEGSVVMGVNGETPVTLTPGQTFYEGPNDIHTVGSDPVRRVACSREFKEVDRLCMRPHQDSIFAAERGRPLAALRTPAQRSPDAASFWSAGKAPIALSRRRR